MGGNIRYWCDRPSTLHGEDSDKVSELRGGAAGANGPAALGEQYRGRFGL
ncbi:MAG: hypothetical protein ABL907_07750 [Hyphomicrobium sp.]